MNDITRRSPDVECEHPSCDRPATVVVGVGWRLLGRQRLEEVRLRCAAHATNLGLRPLCELSLDEWLKIDLAPFLRRWHRRGELDAYLRAQRER